MSILFAILLFSLLIFLHELGHFTMAKLSGVRVNEFAVFMGPAIWKKQKGETLYSIRCIPIGGYCAMEGEDGGDVLYTVYVDVTPDENARYGMSAVVSTMDEIEEVF